MVWLYRSPFVQMFLHTFHRVEEEKGGGGRHSVTPTPSIYLSTPLFSGTVSRDFLLQVFFHESPSPKPLIITLGSFRIFSKIHGDIRKSRCTTGVNDTGGKLPPVSTTPAANLPPVSRTPAANFATSSPCVVDTGGKLPPVSTTLAANLLPVSLTPVANNGNNIRLQTPVSELKGKNLYICFLYYPKVTKQNY